MTEPHSVSDLASQLSPRQQAMLRLLGEGLSLSESAARLEVSRSTANSHRARLMERLGLSNRDEVIAFARQWLAERETSSESDVSSPLECNISVGPTYASAGTATLHSDRHSPSARFVGSPP